MPYQASSRLPAERASKLGHLEVLNSPLVQQLVKEFEEPDVSQLPEFSDWQSFPPLGDPLDIVFAVDGSWQPIVDERPPFKALAFVKTALMKIDQVSLKRIDTETPHPFAIRDLMKDAALYHATVFPLRHIHTKGMSVYDAVRISIFDSIKDSSLDGEVMKTLKWLAYEKWRDDPRPLPPFQCPHCASDRATLPIDAEQGTCPACGKQIFITDMLGFHLEMAEDAASDSVATAYMNIHETLLLFTGIRHFWQSSRQVLKRCLFIKDGPLQIRAQYSKLVNPIRNFLLHSFSEGFPVSLIGQEKTGTFAEHLDMIGRYAPAKHLFIPDHTYICEHIQHRPPIGAPYGRDTNYGAKMFVIPNERYKLVLSVPVHTSMSQFILQPDIGSVINLHRILATIPTLLSSKFENGLLPIELANSVASLSTYPSAKVLRLFTDANVGRETAIRNSV